MNFNVNSIITNIKLAQLNKNIVTAFFNTQALKMIEWNTNVYFATRIIKEVR